MFRSRFQLQAHGTSLRRECVAGFTTFAAMAYILAVNPSILAVSGMDRAALLTATALAAALGSALMGWLTNYPLALAPGMGINAFFAFTVCQTLAVPWQAALALVFCSGFLFLLLSLTGLRAALFRAFPSSLKLAISAGIGIFLALLGLKNAGILAPHPVTFVTRGDLTAPPALLAFATLLISAALLARNVRGALLLGILFATAAGLALPHPDGPGTLTTWPSALVAWPPSLAPTLLQMDFRYVLQHAAQLWPIVLAFLFVDLFDTMGTLIGVSHRAGLLDDQGHLPQLNRALSADAASTMIGATLGTSTTTTYIESAAGIEAGGRTGLVSLVVAACFVLALPFAPIFLAVPLAATAPALIIVGVLMMESLFQLDARDLPQALPAFLTALAIPLTFSISDGIALGYLTHVGLHCALGRFRSVSPTGYCLAALFALHFFTV